MSLSFLIVSLLSMVTHSFALNAAVTVDWTNVIATSKTTTTLQVVVNALLTRQSPIHDQTFKSLADLNADFVRFVPWWPYPKLGVAQLYPPSGEHLCAHLNGNSNNNNWSVSITCPQTSLIKSIDFASWGTPSGSCGNFSINETCHAPNSLNISKTLCLNKHSCTIDANTDTFDGDPCNGTIKQFDIQVTCSIPYNYSNWNFSLMNPLVEDFMNAVNPRNESNKTVINFSIIPNWFYQNIQYGQYIADSQYDTSLYDQQYEVLIDPNGSALATYLSNIISYYTNNGFTDEYGNKINSDYNYMFDMYEVLNEPDLGRNKPNKPEGYTLVYDTIVDSIRKYVDPKKEMKFMGMALGGHNEYSWYNYFLNHSNHIEGIPIDYISFHFYAHPSSRTNPTVFQTIFGSADNFIAEVQNITSIRDILSPNTKISIDELGVILPGDNQNSPNPPDIYWNAAGAMFAYLFPQLAIEGIDILGQSQLMGYPPLSHSQFPANPGDLPPQYASVSLIDWNTGVGNAKYWILKLLLDHFKIGDKLVQTRFTGNGTFYAQGFVSNDSIHDKKILIINKMNQNISVTLNGFNAAKIYMIDEECGNGGAYIYEIYDNRCELRRFAVGVVYPS